MTKCFSKGVCFWGAAARISCSSNIANAARCAHMHLHCCELDSTTLGLASRRLNPAQHNSTHGGGGGKTAHTSSASSLPSARSCACSLASSVLGVIVVGAVAAHVAAAHKRRRLCAVRMCVAYLGAQRATLACSLLQVCVCVCPCVCASVSYKLYECALILVASPPMLPVHVRACVRSSVCACVCATNKRALSKCV